ncbi:hypothetical protein [Methylobacterium sp. P1-11]|uniref:hypothetical protein n=1 Tax=Methylobacterium sp. P1-11 TaxID=2024616 RepID=UPI001FED4D01|nr:hypothetical protein [Methylobacterium sp. P1-11]
MGRLLLRLLLGVRPAAPEPARVHGGERELCAGPDLGAQSSAIAKLSRTDAERLLGTPLKVLR